MFQQLMWWNGKCQYMHNSAKFPCVQKKSACNVCSLHMHDSAKFPYGAREKHKWWTEKMSVHVQ